MQLSGEYLQEVVNGSRMAVGQVVVSGVPMSEWQQAAALAELRKESRMDSAVVRRPFEAKPCEGAHMYYVSHSGPTQQIRCSPAVQVFDQGPASGPEGMWYQHRRYHTAGRSHCSSLTGNPVRALLPVAVQVRKRGGHPRIQRHVRPCPTAGMADPMKD